MKPSQPLQVKYFCPVLHPKFHLGHAFLFYVFSNFVAVCNYF